MIPARRTVFRWLAGATVAVILWWLASSGYPDLAALAALVAALAAFAARPIPGPRFRPDTWRRSG